MRHQKKIESRKLSPWLSVTKKRSSTQNGRVFENLVTGERWRLRCVGGDVLFDRHLGLEFLSVCGSEDGQVLEAERN